MGIFTKYSLMVVLVMLISVPAAGQRKKVGLVLGGGGAKGVAHITAIKVIEQAGIPIDYIAGTSIGAIIGGLYAIGYSSDTLDSLVRIQNWPDLLADRVPRRALTMSEREMKEKYVLTVPLSFDNKLRMPSGLVSGNNVMNLLTELTLQYNDSISFCDLPIPFACVAYDLTSGKVVTLDRGSLPEAIRASMSIPGAFEPVRIDSMVLIDGGIANNFPADVVKAMGAEIIIGIDLSAGPKGASEIQNVADMFTQITWFTGADHYHRNTAMTDVHIHPDVEGYTSASFAPEAIDSLLVRGERGAMEKWDELVALKAKIGIDSHYVPATIAPVDMNPELEIGDISFSGVRRQSVDNLMRISGMKPNTVATAQDISTAVTRLQGMGSLSEVQYSLEGNRPYQLVFHVKEASRNSLSLGVRFDSEEKAALMLSAHIAPSAMTRSHFEITGRLSENPYIRGALIIGSEASRRLSLSYRFKYNNLDVYDFGNKQSNLDFMNHTLDLNYFNIQIRNFRAGLGVVLDYYKYQSVLTNLDVDFDTSSNTHVSYYFNAHFESLDDGYLPKRGILFDASYNLYTTNFVTNDGGSPYSAAQLDFSAALSPHRRLTLMPGIFGRVLIGNDISLPTSNVMGGMVAARYFPQQIPFVGIGHFEFFDEAILGVRLDARVRLWKKQYVTLRANYAKTDSDFFNLHNGEGIWGYGVLYSYPTLIGPLDLQLDYSDRTKSLGFYFNMGYYF